MGKKTINAVLQHNPTPEFAVKLLAELRTQGVTMEQIAKRSGVHKRSLHRAGEIGFVKFSLQHLLECMAGRR